MSFFLTQPCVPYRRCKASSQHGCLRRALSNGGGVQGACSRGAVGTCTLAASSPRWTSISCLRLCARAWRACVCRCSHELCMYVAFYILFFSREKSSPSEIELFIPMDIKIYVNGYPSSVGAWVACCCCCCSLFALNIACVGDAFGALSRTSEILFRFISFSGL